MRPTSGRPGYKAIVREDGSHVGWVGGACTEHILVTEARRALAEGSPRILRVTPTPDPHRAAGDGVVERPMVCASGGTVEVFLEPNLPRTIFREGERGVASPETVDSPSGWDDPLHASEYARHLSELVARREPFAVATVTRTEGSTLAKPGFKLVINSRGEIVGGTFGGGCPEGPVVESALDAIRRGEPRTLRIHLVDTAASVAGTLRETDPNEIWVQTNCGGTLDVYIEPMSPSHRLIVVGQGGRDDVESALVHLGMRLGMEVIVVDPNPDLPEAPHQLITDSRFDPVRLDLGPHDSVVVLTKGERDAAVLEALSRVPLRYVGLLASRGRVAQNLAELAKRGVPSDFVSSLRAPIGLDIGAKTPEELAVAILGEVIATKYGKDSRRTGKGMHSGLPEGQGPPARS